MHGTDTALVLASLLLLLVPLEHVHAQVTHLASPPRVINWGPTSLLLLP